MSVIGKIFEWIGIAVTAGAAYVFIARHLYLRSLRPDVRDEQ